MALLDDDEVIEGGRVGCRRVRVVAHVGPSTRATQWLIERAVDVGADAPTRRFGFPASTRSPAPRWKVSTKIEGLHREEAWDALLQRLGDLDRAMVAPPGGARRRAPGRAKASGRISSALPPPSGLDGDALGAQSVARASKNAWRRDLNLG
jgi:hypothetical protein